MKLFECQNCGQLLFFENTVCEKCGHTLGYLPRLTALSALTQEGDAWRSLVDPDCVYRFCANAGHAACNWLIRDPGQSLCQACRLNRTVPDLSQPDNLARWQRLEGAKHRLVYSLLRLGLPITGRAEDPEAGLAFDFLADPDPSFRDAPKVITGHAEGLITINIAEADDAQREKHRQSMAEPYRTLLGHLRHEVGHHYWEKLIKGSPRLDKFRELFGDEREDYGAALDRHYAEGPPANWRDAFVSAYATTHPWEDWAETWAHYLHIVDTLETGYTYGLRVRPQAGGDPTLAATIDFDSYDEPDLDAIVRAWLPLTFAVNSLNRSMGQPDLYPFVLTARAVEKLRFVHDVVRQARNAAQEATD